MWNEMANKLSISTEDPLLEQSVYQEMFAIILYCNTHSNEMSADELNVMRYVSGYVARSLLKRYEVRTGDMYSQYVSCLGTMAVAHY